MPTSLTVLALGDWKPGRLCATWLSRSSRRIVSEVEQIIDRTWSRISNQPGVHLFDGPMCRLESFEASPTRLSLTLSRTSYKPFLGTNLHNPQLAKTYGRDVLANPVGVSALLETADRFLLLGRRNATVAYYPDRVHPFAGALEPDDGADPFGTVYRELGEELALSRERVGDVRCTGLVEDAALLQPELIFAARTGLTRAELERRLDRVEHHATYAVTADAATVESALRDPALTPVGVASLLLWGRVRFGDGWWESQREFRS